MGYKESIEAATSFQEIENVFKALFGESVSQADAFPVEKLSGFADRQPFMTDDGIQDKATYEFNSDHDKQLAINGAKMFGDTFKKYTKDSPLMGKFNHSVYFDPDEKAILRLENYDDAWAEYALHAVTSTIGEGYNRRVLDKSKVDNLGNLYSVIADADSHYESRGKIYYVKKVRDGKKPNAEIVLELSSDGHFEGYRYVTQLPNRKKSASSVIPVAEDLGQEQSDGTPSLDRTSNIVPLHGTVKQINDLAELGITTDTNYDGKVIELKGNGRVARLRKSGEWVIYEKDELYDTAKDVDEAVEMLLESAKQQNLLTIYAAWEETQAVLRSSAENIELFDAAYKGGLLVWRDYLMATDGISA